MTLPEAPGGSRGAVAQPCGGPVGRRGRHAWETAEARGNAAGDEPGVTASRRQLLAMAAVGGVGAATVAAATPASAHDRHQQRGGARGTTFRLTVLGTTDLHGNVFNWDYFKNAEYTTAPHNDIGVAKVATLINGVRAGAARGEPILTLDAGDTIQGTPLAYYYAKIDPITERRAPPDGRRDERDRLRRRGARQPRVQLRHRHAARLPVAAATSRCSAPTRSTRRPGGRPSRRTSSRRFRPPARAGRQGRHPRPDQPRHRDLGQGQRRGQDASSPAWSSRPRCSCPS